VVRRPATCMKGADKQRGKEAMKETQIDTECDREAYNIQNGVKTEREGGSENREESRMKDVFVIE